MRRSLAPVGAFVGVYLVGFAVAAAVRGNQEFVFYIAVMCALIGLVWGMDRRVRFSPLVLWGLALWGLAHLAGGIVVVGAGPEGPRVLYSFWLIPQTVRYDHLIHGYGFGVCTFVVWESLVAATGGAVRASVGVVACCALGAQGLGAANEIVEFIATKAVPQTNVGGYENTAWDLVSNCIGSTVAAVVVWRTGGRMGGGRCERPGAST